MSTKPSYGILDLLFEDPIEPKRPIFLVTKKTPMRDAIRAVLLLTDGGSRHSEAGERYFLRCIVKEAASLEQCGPGSLVLLASYQKNFVGDQKEVIIVASDVQVVGFSETFDPNSGEIFYRHPSNPGGPPHFGGHEAPQQAPPQQAPPQNNAVPPQNESFGPMRRQAAPMPRAEPFASAVAVRPGGSAVARTSDASILPIVDLNVFVTRWTIKARVSVKGEIRKYNTQKGEGQLFSCDLVDSQGGEIRATFFNKAVDKFADLLRENEVFTWSKGQVKAANKRFNTLNHACELSFGEDAEILPADDDVSIPKKSYTFTKIGDIQNLQKGDNVDVCAMVTRVGDISAITLKSTGEPKDKRDVTLSDDSGHSVDLTLWGDKCKMMQAEQFASKPIIAIKGARVDEFQGLKLSLVYSSSIEIEPDRSETKIIRDYFQNARGETVNLSSAGKQGKSDATRVTLAEMYAQTSGASASTALDDKGLWFNCVATLYKVDSNRRWFWTACATCNKKVQEASAEGGGFGDGHGTTYFCPQCNVAVDTPVKRYILNAELRDATDSVLVTCMADYAEALIGYSADAVDRAKDCEDERGYDLFDYFLWPQFQEYVFKIQAKSEVYMDERRVKYKLFGAEACKDGVVSREANSRLSVIKTLAF